MGKKDTSVTNILMCIPMARYAIVTVSLPALSLAYCFISAFLFRHDEVNDTDCKDVPHTIPSISGVTGIYPQAWVWRVCIGLHSSPRFFVGLMYFNYYVMRLPKVEYRGLARFLMSLSFWLYSTECLCLLTVSCISNKENYPLHEKIFILFMTCSIANMVFHTLLYRLAHPDKTMTELQRRSYFWKKIMLVVISLSTICLLRYFYLHRFHCVPEAFSKFSACEYFIAYSNIGFHFTALWDLAGQNIIAASFNNPGSNGSAEVDGSGDGQTNGNIKQARRAVENGRTKAE